MIFIITSQAKRFKVLSSMHAFYLYSNIRKYSLETSILYISFLRETYKNTGSSIGFMYITTDENIKVYNVRCLN